MKISAKDWLRKLVEGVDEDFLRSGLAALARGVMELEVSELAGADRYERSDERADVRNGYRNRRWDTRAGSVELRIPKLRGQGYQPSFLEPRRRSEAAMLAVVQEAYVLGVSTRKVEDLVRAMGVESMDKSQVSRMCAELDERVTEWRTRKLEGRYPYLWVDAKYLHVREGSRVVKKALVVGYGVREDGFREVVGVDVFALESAATWRSFLRSLIERGLHGVELVISDAHVGLREAIGEVFVGAGWQRCYVHFMRNMEGHLPRRDRPALKAVLKRIFDQTTHKEAQQHLREAAERLAEKHPKLAALLDDAEASVLAYMAFPEAHWRQIRSTNPLERLNKEIGRRADVVGIFPNDASVLRLIGMVLCEQDDEWKVGRRYFSLESMAQLRVKEQPKLEEAPAQGRAA